MKDLSALGACPDAQHDPATGAQEIPDLAVLVGGIASASPTAVFDLHDLVARCAEKEGFNLQDADEVLLATTNVVIDAIWEGALVEPKLLPAFISTLVRVRFKLRAKAQNAAAQPRRRYTIQ